MLSSLGEITKFKSEQMKLQPFSRSFLLLTGLTIVMVISAASPATLSAQQLITMSNKCVKRMKAGDEANAAGNYQEALSLFEQALQKCKA